MSIQSNFPSIKPSLLLDFANTKKLDSRVTFTRSTTATYYDGVTTAKAEENLFFQSQTFDNSDWSKTATTVTANAATAPDGTSTADQMIETADTSNHRVQQGMNAINGLTYTFSVFAKKGVLASARNFIQLAVPTTPFGVNAYANFDILNGTIPTQGAGLVSAAITNVGSGWYRCSIVATATSTIAANFWLQIAQSGTDAILPSYAGSTSADVLLWGAQVEQRSSVTAYTATTTQTITNYIPVLQTAASGVPRFDHNPTTDESLGLLIEEQRTNLFTYSAQLDNAAWTKTNTTITADTIVAPDGTLTGDKVVENTAAGFHYVRQNISVSAAAHTISFFAKAAERSFVWATLDGGSNQGWFNLSAGTTGLNGIGSTQITSVGNGWYRCIYTATLSAGTAPCFIYLATSTSTASYTGDGFSGAYIWGAQLEAGSFATSYIPTVASTVTRNADAASMTGTNFSSWFSAAEGTLYAEGLSQPSLTTISGLNAATIANLDTGTAENGLPRLARDSGGGTGRYAYYFNGQYQAHFTNLGAWPNSTNGKIIGAYRVNDFAASFNGGTVQTDGAGVLGVADRINIGRYGSDGYWNGTIKKIAYYPLRVTNAQLQALTS